MSDNGKSFQANTANPHHRVLALDGVRGLAILMVMGYHFLMPFGSGNRLEQLVLAVFDRMWIGVELFFVLSGYLITTILWNARVVRRDQSLRNFYMRRFLRITPLYCAIILGVWATGFLTPKLWPEGWYQFQCSQIYLWLYAVNIGRSYHGAGYFSFGWFDFTHFWTLAVEEYFYLIWPWVVFFANRRMFFLTCGLLFFGSLAVRIWEANGGSGWGFALTASLRQSESILIGSFLAVLMIRIETRSWIERIARPGFILWGTLAAGLLTFWPRSSGLVVIFAPILLGFTFASLLVLILNADQQSRERRLFESRFLRFFGQYSYGLYIFHQLLFPVWLAIATRVDQETGCYRLGVAASLLTATVVSIGLSLLSWNLIEQPLLGWKKRFEPKPAVLDQAVLIPALTPI